MTSLFYLVNKQVNEYLLRRKIFRQRKKRDFKPCVVFSRENGTGGRLIARKVAEKLGFKLYDKDLIWMIAHKTKLKKGLIRSVDEKTQNTIESIINTFLGFEPLPEYEYIRALTRVVLSIVAKGKAVILGRGGNFIVPPEFALRVRIIAPLKVRLKNSQQFEYPGKSLDYIKDKMLKIHKERKDFVQKYFSKNVSNANYYDLVINTEYLTIKQATEIVITAFKERFDFP